MQKPSRMLAVVFIIVGLFTFAGCEKEGPMEKAGEKIDETVEETGEELDEAADEAEERMNH